MDRTPSYEYLLHRCGELERETLQLIELNKELVSKEQSLYAIISSNKVLIKFQEMH